MREVGKLVRLYKLIRSTVNVLEMKESADARECYCRG